MLGITLAFASVILTNYVMWHLPAGAVYGN